jgi:hypothetical protein
MKIRTGHAGNITYKTMVGKPERRRHEQGLVSERKIILKWICARWGVEL